MNNQEDGMVEMYAFIVRDEKIPACCRPASPITNESFLTGVIEMPKLPKGIYDDVGHMCCSQKCQLLTVIQRVNNHHLIKPIEAQHLPPPVHDDDSLMTVPRHDLKERIAANLMQVDEKLTSIDWSKIEEETKPKVRVTDQEKIEKFAKEIVDETMGRLEEVLETNVTSDVGAKHKDTCM
ncbi:Protein of unknown function [Cotesia congregata]|uniref:Uncharacterized protein n=1 Tax=Cotesia congregata TaxID=51543 RepID=A0A8J2N0B9_COTCN|nr:Protein of unknown function [Cotesia congregata]